MTKGPLLHELRWRCRIHPALRQNRLLRTVADAHGNMKKEVLYDPFGDIIEDTNPTLRVPTGFASGLYYPNLEFVRFGWLDYDVKTGN
jgi:hypothetical protein